MTSARNAAVVRPVGQGLGGRFFGMIEVKRLREAVDFADAVDRQPDHLDGLLEAVVDAHDAVRLDRRHRRPDAGDLLDPSGELLVVLEPGQPRLRMTTSPLSPLKVPRNMSSQPLMTLMTTSTSAVQAITAITLTQAIRRLARYLEMRRGMYMRVGDSWKSECQSQSLANF